MTTLELQTRKVELAKRILSSNNEELIEKMSNLYNKIAGSYPCDFTIEEVAQACEEAIKQYKEGTITPHSQIKRKVHE
ncbi:hypothetical protein [Bacteroides sp. 519]|uniref:hypothetical protein n=1 Tax=Bacteroides sp. 519 TaxID=2302937 RepID=UPI0013D6D456|nr:hypothetical protein [Bacteroides sp. 519]NDV57714.1 hypothetical protein [Bacteroides sp. 519]